MITWCLLLKVGRENQLHIPPQDGEVVNPKKLYFEPAKTYGPEAVLRPGVKGNFEPAVRTPTNEPG